MIIMSSQVEDRYGQEFNALVSVYAVAREFPKNERKDRRRAELPACALALRDAEKGLTLSKKTRAIINQQVSNGFLPRDLVRAVVEVIRR